MYYISSLQITARVVMFLDGDSLKERLLAHDERAFSVLVDSYVKLLWSVAGGIIAPTGSAEDIEECVSDVFMELWAHPQKFDPARGSVKSYLCIMAKSRALNTLRKMGKDNTISFEDSPQEPAYEESAGFNDYSELYEAIRQMPTPTKEILVRRYFNDEKPHEIARKMKLPKKEIENRLYRGKQALKARLSEKKEVL